MVAPLWTPSAERSAGSQMAAFAAHAGVGALDLHDWSIRQPDRFWRLAWDWCEVVGEPGGGPALTTGLHLSDARFFPDAILNYAENLLRRDDDQPALLFRCEDGTARDLTWADLHALVSRLQQALLGAGVGQGDRVAAWLPNLPEAYAVMLAAASIGAVFSSTSPDFGASGVLDRFGQIQPTVLFATDGYRYGGKRHDVTGKLAEVAADLPTVRQVVVVPDSADGPTGPLPDGAVTLDDFLAPHTAVPVAFEPLPFDHPLYILYSSGTTGEPKCIVHRAGGLLLKHHVEYRLHCDVRPDDRVCYFTTAGWMMWNWLAAGLAAEAALVLYDGSPFHPGAEQMFDLVDATGTTLLGVSAKFIDAVAKSGLRPVESHDLSTLRTVCSTGSPLSPEGFSHVYADWKADLHLASISGGTDLCGCLVGGDPTLPVHAGQIQGPVLGQAMDVFDEEGSPAPIGQQGELVCTAPFPSMPLGFWNDPDGDRYRSAYFERFDGAWHQGDFAERTPEGGFIIHGRSDATLNPGGVRIGTAEVYRQVDRLDEVVESLVIGQPWEGDTRIVLFVVPASGVELDDDLVGRIRSAIRTGASPRHVPAVVLAVPDLPRTRSGKLVEMAVRNVVEGRPVTNLEALANPEALEAFRSRPELA
ncbi:MAG: acetoacetate--CoA ligase [Acidimicrobiaceae bacterium]|nr:acetoacetate--CoA ligase [Acidimicrobiaceae bacterium]